MMGSMASCPACGPDRPSPPVHDYLERKVAAGAFPSAVYAFGPAGRSPAFLGAVGSMAREPESVAARPDALYDLASLTKGVLTAVVAARLADRGEVDLDQPLDPWLDEMTGYGGATPTLASLLTHDAGLPAWVPLYRAPAGAAEVAATIAALPPDRPAGSGALYSCLGPILALVALCRATGKDAARLLDEEIRRPLGLDADEIAFSPLPGALIDRVAPTERGRLREAALAGPGCRSDELVPGPRKVLRGQVHDGNAAFLGGAAGNAGLFSTASALFRLASALGWSSDFLSAAARRRLAEPAASGPGGVRTLGFEAACGEDGPGAPLGEDAFGHVGFTGTSVWLAPAAGWVVVLLTNRVHPAWVEAPMQRWRHEFHQLCRTALESS
ncbi:MAG: serine hydrolase domain-containing protein [Acidobacteriota bacterium]|nr:serine hydrolase domain-containing protein [Acidobacteriota bacterium]